MQIDAYQTALIETKLKYRNEIERLQMTLAEVESRKLNEVVTKKETNYLLGQFERGFMLQNLREAKDKIAEFVRSVKSMEMEKEALEKQIERERKFVVNAETRLADKHSYFKEERRLRTFYQKLLFKFMRDLEVLGKDNEKNARFDILNEDDLDMNYQRQICFVLSELEINDELIRFANKHHGHVENLKLAYE